MMTKISFDEQNFQYRSSFLFDNEKYDLVIKAAKEKIVDINDINKTKNKKGPQTFNYNFTVKIHKDGENLTDLHVETMKNKHTIYVTHSRIKNHKNNKLLRMTNDFRVNQKKFEAFIELIKIGFCTLFNYIKTHVFARENNSKLRIYFVISNHKDDLLFKHIYEKLNFNRLKSTTKLSDFEVFEINFKEVKRICGKHLDRNINHVSFSKIFHSFGNNFF